MFIILFQCIIIILFFLLWQFLSDKKIINSFIFSSPKHIFNTIIKLYKEQNLFMHILTTIKEVLISFILASIIGLLLSTLLWFNKTLYKIIEPFLTLLNSLPKIALGPIIIIWFGAGINSIIIMSLLISLIITIINIYEGFNNIDNNKILLMKSLCATKFDLYLKLILPGSIKTIISTLKINISMSLIGVIMGEFLVSKKGIGYIILYGSQIFNLSLVISGIFILMIVAFFMYYIINLLEKKISF